MSKLIELDEFRAGGSGSTILCYSQADDTWICGDSSGLVHTLTKDNNSTSNSAADTAITSMAVSPGGDLCALGLHQRIDIHAFPNVDNVKFQYAIRTALDITHISYEADGNHM